MTAVVARDRRLGAADAAVRDLRLELPGAAVLTDADVIEGYRRDEAVLVPGGAPAAVVLPRSTRDVRAVLRIASLHGVAVVPRGAGSGLSGGAAAVDGGLVVSLAGLDRIVEIDTDDLTATVQPGVINGDLKDAVAEHGLAYPPDPASARISTMGGNIATNAGGLCCVKYGVTRDWVLNLEVVLADGALTRIGRRTVKGVAGYDLAGLLVGSEGTLGIVTEATVRLRPAPPPPATVVASFPTAAAAGVGAAAITRSGIVPSLLELMDRTTIAAVDDFTRMGLDRDAGALLLAQSDAPGDHAGREAAAIAAACEAAGATYVAHTADPQEAEQLLAARKVVHHALEQRGLVVSDDVAVPRSRVPALLADIERIADEHGLLVATFGHIGDGNLHPTIVLDRQPDAGQLAVAGRAFDAIVRAAVAHGGTCTGEHGVGVMKRHLLAEELDATAVGLHRAIKQALDPAAILNPGKALP